MFRMSENPKTNLIEYEDLSLTLGDKLRILRTRRQMSSEGLGKLLGVSRNTVMAYELNRITSPRPEILLQWCLHTFGRPSEIMGEAYAHLDEMAQRKMTELENARRARMADELAAVVEEEPAEDGVGLELLHLLQMDESHGDMDEGPTDTFTWTHDRQSGEGLHDPNLRIHDDGSLGD